MSIHKPSFRSIVFVMMLGLLVSAARFAALAECGYGCYRVRGIERTDGDYYYYTYSVAVVINHSSGANSDSPETPRQNYRHAATCTVVCAANDDVRGQVQENLGKEPPETCCKSSGVSFGGNVNDDCVKKT